MYKLGGVCLLGVSKQANKQGLPYAHWPEVSVGQGGAAWKALLAGNGHTPQKTTYNETGRMAALSGGAPAISSWHVNSRGPYSPF